MGRVKLKIKRIESSNNRQVTYSKRRNGIMKKAYELSVLCDIDIILLMFAPNGKPSLFTSADGRNLEHVIAKFAQLTPEERAKRKLLILERLQATFQKLDHEVNVEDFLGSSSLIELRKQVRMHKMEFEEVQKRLRFWNNLDKIDNVNHLTHMEESLKDSLNYIQLHKENIGKNQLISVECRSEGVNCLSDLGNGMHLPMVTSAMQESQSLSWLPNNYGQQVVFKSDEQHNYLSQRCMEGSSNASSVLGYCSNFFSNSGKQSDNNTDTLSLQVDNPTELLLEYGCGGLNDITVNGGGGYLGLQVGPHNDDNPYSPYGGHKKEIIIGESTTYEINYQNTEYNNNNNSLGDFHHQHHHQVVTCDSFDLSNSIYSSGGGSTWVSD